MKQDIKPLGDVTGCLALNPKLGNKNGRNG